MKHKHLIIIALVLLVGCAECKNEILVQLPVGKIVARAVRLSCQSEYRFAAPCDATIVIGERHSKHYIEVKGEGATMDEAWMNAVKKLDCIQPGCIEGKP